MGQAVPDPTVQYFVQNNKMNVRNIKYISRYQLGLSVRMQRMMCAPAGDVVHKAFHCLGQRVVQPCVESIKKKNPGEEKKMQPFLFMSKNYFANMFKGKWFLKKRTEDQSQGTFFSLLVLYVLKRAIFSWTFLFFLKIVFLWSKMYR